MKKRLVCKVCGVPGCIEARGADFHKGTRFGSLKCDYAGEPPFPDDTHCRWCAGTGHPYGDESYGICECPKLVAEQKKHIAAFLQKPKGNP